MPIERAQIDPEQEAARLTHRLAPLRPHGEEAAAAVGAATPMLPAFLPAPPRAGRGFAPLRAASVLGLQQTLGNQAVQRLMQRSPAPPGQTPPEQEVKDKDSKSVS